MSCLAAIAAFLAVSHPCPAQETIATELVADGLTAPNLVTSAGDGSGRRFIVDQAGQIRIVDAGGTLLPTPFLDISTRMVPLGAFGPGSFDERGLLGLAFHPNFATNRKFYTYYSAPRNPDNVSFDGPIPPDVTLSGGIVGTVLVGALYCNGINSFEVQTGQMASIEFAEPLWKVRFFFVHRVGASPGTIAAIRPDGTTLGTAVSNQATVRCDPANFVTFEELGFPVIGIKRLELQAGIGAGLVLFLDDMDMFKFNHQSRISEFTVPPATPDQADPNSERVILQIDEPQFNHNSGTVAFGPTDGLLYVSVGDGGNGNDVGPFHNATLGNGQDTTNLLGTILRIDVNGEDFPADPNRNYAVPPGNLFAGTPGCADGCDEIWAFGLRNPFRFSFDSGGTHDLFCGDAGQDLFEEVSIIGAGQNMGWNIKEGLHCFDPANPGVPPVLCSTVGQGGEPLIDPIIEYPHFDMGTPVGQVVIGGDIYRGSLFPGLAGKLVFGDFSLPPFGGPADGSIFIGTEVSPGTWARTQPTISNGTGGRLMRAVMGFGIDAAGEVYVCTNTTTAPFGTTGAVFRIVPSKGDMNGDGSINGADAQLFVDVLTGVNTDPALRDRADMNGDGTPDTLDIAGFISAMIG